MSLPDIFELNMCKSYGRSLVCGKNTRQYIIVLYDITIGWKVRSPDTMKQEHKVNNAQNNASNIYHCNKCDIGCTWSVFNNSTNISYALVLDQRDDQCILTSLPHGNGLFTTN